ncbi:MAG: hypothetical protein K0R71_193 [Bacillales bacterium]|jgi:hypothetical protein|nr:hypothetical protein [Bacillales bacterium]
MNFYQSFVNQRIRTLTPNEVVSLAPGNGVFISLEEASKVSRLLNSSNINVFNTEERMALFDQITKITSSFVATEFERIIQFYLSKKVE